MGGDPKILIQTETNEPSAFQRNNHIERNKY